MVKDKTKRRDVSVGKDEAHLIAAALRLYRDRVHEESELRQEQVEFIELIERRWTKIEGDWKA